MPTNPNAPTRERYPDGGEPDRGERPIDGVDDELETRADEDLDDEDADDDEDGELDEDDDDVEE